MKKISSKILISIFLISFAALMLEISLIRTLSLIYNYNFAMLIISISLFGMAVGGSFIYIKKINNPYYLSLILFSLSTIIGYLIFSQLLFDPTKASYNYSHAFILIIYYILFAIPFFFFGLILAYTFKKYQKQSGKIYFSNLLGSSLGCLFALVSISYLGHYSINLSAFIAIIPSLFFIKKKYQKIITIIIFLIIFIPLPINLSEDKELTRALNVPNSIHLESIWNSFSRLDLVNSSYTNYAPGLSLAYNETLPNQLGLLIDGGGMTSLTENNNYRFTNYLPSSIAYHLIENPNILLINPQAGPDIISGIKNNATLNIIEYNPTVIDLAKKYKFFSGNIYKNTNIIQEHGRKHVKKNISYDIIKLSLSGDVHSSGFYGLSQDYDLTLEGLKDYYNALNENGYLIITRWLSYPPKETLRLFYLAKEVTEKENIVMFRSWSTITLILGKNPDLYKIYDFTHDKKFDIVYMNKNFTPNLYSSFEEPIYYNYIKEIDNNPDFYKDYIFDVSVVTDNRPFYYNFFKLNKMEELHSIMGRNWQPFNDPGFLMLLLFFQSLILCLIFILLPLFVKYKLPNYKILFFLFIGIAYMLIEINLIQHFVKIFGNITHSSAFIISIMLASSGFGSYLSHKFKTREVFITICSLILILFLFINDMISYLLLFNKTTSIILSSIILIPLGFFMGMPFPKAILKIDKKDIAWAFSVNGSASVLSSIAVLIIAIFFGFSIVLIIALILYILAWIFLFK